MKRKLNAESLIKGRAEMNSKEYKSKCCSAEVRVCGGDSGKEDDCTFFNVCAKCGKACGVKVMKGEGKMIDIFYWNMIVRDRTTGVKGRVQEVDFWEQTVRLDNGSILPIKNLEDITSEKQEKKSRE